MKLSFDAYDPDGAPRANAGMWRPPLDELLSGTGYAYTLMVGERTYRVCDVKGLWAKGEFDRSLYCDHSGEEGA